MMLRSDSECGHDICTDSKGLKVKETFLYNVGEIMEHIGS